MTAPDLRGHGDSDWATGASYNEVNYIYDIAQLVHQKEMAPVTIIAHSLGGSIGLLDAGVFPETVRRIVAIEGLGPSPQMRERLRGVAIEQRLRDWITARRESSGRMPRDHRRCDHADEGRKQASQ